MKIFSDDTIKDYSKTIGERNEVDEVLTLALLPQNILGHNVLHPNWSWETTMGQQSFTIVLFIYAFLGTIEYLKDTTDLTSIGEAYYTLALIAFFVLKYLIFIDTRESFRTAYLIAKTTLIEIIKADSIEKSNEFLKKIKIIVRIFCGSILFPVTMYIVVAMWNYIHGNRVTLSKTTSTLMPMTSPYYEIALILHALFMVNMGFTYCVIDAWFVILMVFFCTANDSLVNMLKVDGNRSDETELEYMDRLNDTLRRFYKNNVNLMEYWNIVCDMHKWSAVHPLLFALFALCLILFLINEQIQWIFLTNLLPVMSEIFAYNWLGDRVKDKGTQLNMALLDYDWASMRVKDRKNYLIIISYMNKELGVKTALGYELSLVTMTSVFKASYQAFAVLKTMD